MKSRTLSPPHQTDDTDTDDDHDPDHHDTVHRHAAPCPVPTRQYRFNECKSALPFAFPAIRHQRVFRRKPQSQAMLRELCIE
jgi:hypothetical protein